jgi:hypothetical protein
VAVPQRDQVPGAFAGRRHVVEHAKVNEQGFFHFLTLAAPYVVSPNNKHFYFNPDDMKPLINSEGHLRALEDYVKFLVNGPKEQIGWTLPEGWKPFLSGHAVMEATWGDLPTLAQDRALSSVQGRVGATVIPGTTEAFNPLTGQWEKYPLNVVGNTNGGTWHCVISRLSKKKEPTYDFLAFMANRFIELAEFVKEGHWRHSIDESLYGVDVHSKTLGILGMGRIGAAVARRARLGFNMEVLYYNRSRNPEVEGQFNAKFSTFDDILGAADFLCVVLPLTIETEKMIGAREFAKMKRGSIFINGSRGRIVDQSSLIQSLQTGHLGAAGLDVFEKEPLPADSPLLKMANVVALPHIGSATHETQLNMVRCAVENLLEVLNRGSSKHAVNPQALEHRAPAQS